MTLNRRAQRAITIAFFALLAVAYAISWFAPAVGLHYDDGAWLVAARTIAAGHGYTVDSLPDPTQQTRPPLFAAILALFALVSRQPVWLKLLPLGCTVAWLALTRKLLLKMGASRNDALWLVGLTAACPLVLLLGTNLLAESLFALLVTAALLMLLEGHALATGILAGLATLTQTAGVALIVACIFTLAARRRFRGAVIFTAVSMAMVAPWFGWWLAQAARDYANHTYVASTIFTGLAANEKLVVLARNLYLVIASPSSLLTGGWSGTPAMIATVVVLLWSLFVRRQFLPDLFIALYCIALLFRTSPPQRLIAPILPLALWLVWRVFRLMRLREALAALAVVIMVLPVWATAIRIPATVSNGYFPSDSGPADNWHDMRNLFAFIRDSTPEQSVLLANLDPAFYLNTERKTIRGFTPNGFELYYAERKTALTPDQLSRAILHSRVSYVALTPDRGLPESESFHKSVEALEHGGVLVPVSMPGGLPDYRLLQVVGEPPR